MTTQNMTTQNMTTQNVIGHGIVDLDARAVRATVGLVSGQARRTWPGPPRAPAGPWAS